MQSLTIQPAGLPTPQDWQTMLAMADAMFKSGLLPTTIKSPQAAVLLVQKGRELGIPPTYALSNIVVIQGKPTANAELMLALIYRDHGDDAIDFTEATATIATVTYRRRGWKDRRAFSYTIDDAHLAQLLENQTWKKYPGAMLRARCISAVARLAFPDSIGGMYTPEELGAEVSMDADGEIRIISTGEVLHDPTQRMESPPTAHASQSEQPAPSAATDASSRQTTRAQVDAAAGNLDAPARSARLDRASNHLEAATTHSDLAARWIVVSEQRWTDAERATLKATNLMLETELAAREVAQPPPAQRPADAEVPA